MKRITSLLLITLLVLSLCLAGCGKEPEVDPIDDNFRVFYQIFVGSFSDSNGDGVGDLRGIINRMDYLNDGNINSGSSLGVQGIWLSPIFASPTYHKYDVKDYYQIDEKFGTEEDLKELISVCHERNVKVILDLVLNHTSSESQWFYKFRIAHKNGYTDDPYYDFYTYVTAEERQSNKTYYRIEGTDHYYEANFDSGMPELNYDNEAVREKMVEVAKYYLDLGIDGFRFDAIKYIYYGDTASCVEFWEWYMDRLREIKSDIYAVGECWSADAEVLEYYKALNCFNFTSSQLGTIYSAARNESANAFAGYVESYQKSIKAQNPDAMYCPFIANHDTDRAAGFLPVSFGSMKMAANLYILCCGSPFIYYGEEIGLKGSRGAANTDANRRLAMLWGDGDTVRDPVGATYESDKQINGDVASQLNDSNSLLNYYCKLIAIRNKYPAIARGDYTALDCEDPVCGFSISYGDSVIGLYHNTSMTNEMTVDLPEGFSTVCDYIGQGKAQIKDGKLIIPPQTSVIIE